MNGTECLVEDLNDTKKMNEKLEATIKYLGDPHLLLIHNQERLALNEFGEKSVVKETVTSNRQFDKSKPHWV